MLYLMAEIWIYLLIAALLGALSAWIISHGRALDRVDRANDGWKNRLKTSEEEWKEKVKSAEGRAKREIEERERHTRVLAEQLKGERHRAGGLNDRLAREAAHYQALFEDFEITKKKLRILDDRLAVALEVGDKAEVALRRATADFEVERAGLEEARSHAEEELDVARAQLKEARERRFDLEKRLKGAGTQHEDVAGTPESDESGKAGSDALLRARIRDLEGQVRSLEGQLAEDVDELDRAQEALTLREQRIRDLEPLEDRVRELTDQLELTDRELTRSQEELQRSQEELADLTDREATAGEHADAEDANGRLSRSGLEKLKLAAAVTDLPDLDALLARAPGSGLSGGMDNGPAASDEFRDDLRRIRGIGPVLQRKLRELGYHTFEQIADWTEADIEKICETLPIFPDRIRKEGWVDQARLLQSEEADAAELE